MDSRRTGRQMERLLSGEKGKKIGRQVFRWTNKRTSRNMDRLSGVRWAGRQVRRSYEQKPGLYGKRVA